MSGRATGDLRIARSRGSPRADDIGTVLPEGIGRPVDIPAAIFDTAATIYSSGIRLDMAALAKQAGVGRATLYRRVGDREQLLDQIIWWRTRNVLDRALTSTRRHRGVARIIAAVDQVLHAVESDVPLRAFLDADPEIALRVLLGKGSATGNGMRSFLERLIGIEVTRTTFAPALDPGTLAFAIVRICEGFLYADVIADRVADIDAATTLVAALLRGIDAAKRP